jgi:hypothetical protein
MLMNHQNALKRSHSPSQTVCQLLKVAGLILVLSPLHPLAMMAASAQEQPTQISQRGTAWDGQIRVARLMNREQTITALVVQLEILDKPATTYANAIYQVYAQIGGRWVPVHTNTGARLVNASAGQITLQPEVILLSDMQRLMDREVDWSQVELRTVVTLRYDLQDGQSNQQVEWENRQRFEAIAVTTTPDLISSSSR